MTLEVVFRPAARAEFDGATLWYEDKSPGLGVHFVAEIDRAVDLASKYPERYPLLQARIRCSRVRRIPYSVFYLVEAGRIVVAPRIPSSARAWSLAMINLDPAATNGPAKWT